ncbi:MAG: hypothetical protein ACM3QU_02200 [Verrucomicrobiota bacterium]
MKRYEPSRERDALDDHVDEILADLERMPVEVVHGIASALLLGGDEAFTRLGWAFDAFDPDLLDSPLPHIRLRSWLERAAYAGQVDELLTRLTQATEPPWPAVKDALRAAHARRE